MTTKQTTSVSTKRVLSEISCPVCGKEFLSNEDIVLGTLTEDYARKYTFHVHSKCIGKTTRDFLEKIGFSLIEDSGSWFDDGSEWIENEN